MYQVSTAAIFLRSSIVDTNCLAPAAPATENAPPVGQPRAAAPPRRGRKYVVVDRGETATKQNRFRETRESEERNGPPEVAAAVAGACGQGEKRLLREFDSQSDVARFGAVGEAYLQRDNSGQARATHRGMAPPEAAGCESDCDSDCEAGAASADEAEQAEVEEGAQAPRAAKRRKTAADDEAAEATPDEGTADAQEEEEEIDSEMLDQCQALLDSVAGGSGSEDEAALAELFPPPRRSRGRPPRHSAAARPSLRPSQAWSTATCTRSECSRRTGRATAPTRRW